MTLQVTGSKPDPWSPRERPARGSSDAPRGFATFPISARGASARRVGRRRVGLMRATFRGNPRSIPCSHRRRGPWLCGRRWGSLLPQGSFVATRWIRGHGSGALRSGSTCGRCLGITVPPRSRAAPHVSRHRWD